MIRFKAKNNHSLTIIFAVLLCLLAGPLFHSEKVTAQEDEREMAPDREFEEEGRPIEDGDRLEREEEERRFERRKPEPPPRPDRLNRERRQERSRRSRRSSRNSSRPRGGANFDSFKESDRKVFFYLLSDKNIHRYGDKARVKEN